MQMCKLADVQMRCFAVLFACLLTLHANAQSNLADKDKHYFPLNTVDKFESNWFSSQLTALQEPVIFADKGNAEIYRFTWLRSFHNPIAIRIEKQGSKYLLTWKVCDGAGGYEPGKLNVSKQKAVTESDWEKFKGRLVTADFWNLETQDQTIGADGSEWILEGKMAGQYHVVVRWTPAATTLYHNCCKYLITLTDMKITGEAMY